MSCNTRSLEWDSSKDIKNLHLVFSLKQGPTTVLLALEAHQRCGDAAYRNCHADP